MYCCVCLTSTPLYDVARPRFLKGGSDSFGSCSFLPMMVYISFASVSLGLAMRKSSTCRSMRSFTPL